jgi:hypothetical protein
MYCLTVYELTLQGFSAVYVPPKQVSHVPGTGHKFLLNAFGCANLSLLLIKTPFKITLCSSSMSSNDHVSM